MRFITVIFTIPPSITIIIIFTLFAGYGRIVSCPYTIYSNPITKSPKKYTIVVWLLVIHVLYLSIILADVVFVAVL